MNGSYNFANLIYSRSKFQVLSATVVSFLFAVLVSCIPDEVHQIEVAYNPLDRRIYLRNESDSTYITSVLMVASNQNTCVIDVDSLRLKEFVLDKSRGTCATNLRDSLFIMLEINFEGKFGGYQYRGHKMKDSLGISRLNSHLI